MTKNRSKMLIIFLTLVLIVGLVASFVNFTYPFSVNGVRYKYSSFANELVLGSDINEGVLIEYQAKVRNEADEENYDKLMDNTLQGLRDILNDSGFKNSTVTRNGDMGIRIEVGGIVNKSDSSEVIGLIGDPQPLTFTDANDESKVLATANDVKSVSAKQQAYGNTQVCGVEIVFTTQGYKNFRANLDEMSGDSFNIMLGENNLGSLTKDSVVSKVLQLYSETFVDMQTAKEYATQISTGLLPLNLVCTYNGIISASAGIRGNVANPMLYIWVTFGIMVVSSLIFLALRYKQIGLMAMFNMMFYIVLGLFFLQSVPLVHINFSGVLAMMIGYVLAVIALTTSLENAKNEYARGKKLHTSVRQGINASAVSTITLNVMLALAGSVCALMPNMAIQSFGIVTMVLSLLNIFISQALMRLMNKLYLTLNPEDGKKCNFTKEEVLNND